MSDTPFEISVSVRLDKTVNGFPVAETIVVAAVDGVVRTGGRPRRPGVPDLSLDSERSMHHVVGDRALRQRPVELARERHLERVHVLVMVMVKIVIVMV